MQRGNGVDRESTKDGRRHRQISGVGRARESKREDKASCAEFEGGV